MRWLWLATTVVLVAAVALPGAVGWLAATELQRRFAEPAGQGELIQFERSWFGSRGKLIARLTAPGGTPMDVPLTFAYRHGPLLWLGRPQLAWVMGDAQIVAADVAEQWAFERDQPLWKGAYRVDYLLNGHIIDSAQAFVFADQLAADRWRGQGEASVRGAWRYEGELVGLRMLGDSGPVLLKELNVALRRPAGASGADFSATIAGVQMGGAGDALRAEEVQLRAQWRRTDEVHAGGALTLESSADSLALTGERYSDAALNLSLVPVPPRFAAELGAAVQAVYMGQAPLAAAAELLAAARRELLPVGPQLNVSRLQFVAPAGRFELNGKAGVPAMAAAPAHWLAVLPELDLEVSALAAKPLAVQWAAARSALGQQEALFNSGRAIDPSAVADRAEARAREQLAVWVAAGWLSEDTDHYRVHGLWRDGGLQLNGRPLGLPF